MGFMRPPPVFEHRTGPQAKWEPYTDDFCDCIAAGMKEQQCVVFLPLPCPFFTLRGNSLY